MRSLYAKFQLSSFKTEGGDRGGRYMFVCKMVADFDVVVSVITFIAHGGVVMYFSAKKCTST